MARSQNTHSKSAAIAAAARYLPQDPVRAEAEIRSVLNKVPQSPEALLVLAEALRRQARNREALGILTPLGERKPSWPVVQHELGLALLSQDGATVAAMSALRRAVELDTSFAAGWRALGDALYRLGQIEEADRAYGRFVQGAAGDPLLRDAMDALQNGRPDSAEAQVRLRLASEPTDIVAARVLALICRQTDRIEEAERLLGEVVRRAPSFWLAQMDYIDVLFAQGRFLKALESIETLLAMRPADADLLRLKLRGLADLGDFDGAVSIARQLLALNPSTPGALLQLAHLLRVTGGRDEAIDLYKRAIALDPHCGAAYMGLADMKTYRFTEADAAAMTRALDKKNLDQETCLAFRFALGQALDQLGRFEEAFRNFAVGNALERMRVHFNSDAIDGFVLRSIQNLTPSFFARRVDTGSKDHKPIFIVGMPRSGSTLVEQILASHSDVEALGELPTIHTLASKLTRGRGDLAYPQALCGATDGQFAELAGIYVQQVEILQRTQRRRVIDKLPNNFLHVGFIHLLFPNASIIDVRRHPMACGLSNFMHLFGRGHEFSYRLRDIGRYYRAYVELMTHYDAVLPGRIHRVIYEDLIAQPEIQIRALLASCGLGFEGACLNPHATQRPIVTPSAEQVRQPLRRGADDHWRHYALWLEPLADALGPVLEAYPALPSAF
ncbi:MAG: sulfotransferase [Alphaproteobacteria bacterium]|nr:sulfotransferase [Alphaproteobacteria bacterium]